ncbi:dienelactone hydrolase family protein [uncultured Roseobacter sp.]|uniref:dienelactone hydrolase family protein n=1 Tax=uncultured Roseobacter sp. TaxID=114847 RepID=UPI00263A3A74|nr:dienelactone hydrolase family protein [uncultured Roseobacter sp.]
MMVATREVTYDVDGLSMIGYLAQPNGPGPWPAVLIGHDGVGLEEYQRQRVDDLAAHGYLALAMEYHGGEVFFDRPDAMLSRIMPLLADVERLRSIGRAAFDVLLAQPGVDPDRIAALGYGAGGRIVLELARAGVPFKAIAVVHSAFPDNKVEEWSNFAGTFLLCTGSEDPICTPEQILTFGRALQEAGIDWRAEIYGGAEHAFWAQPRKPDGSLAEGTAHSMTTVPGVSYDPKATMHAWRAVLDLFGETF